MTLSLKSFQTLITLVMRVLFVVCSLLLLYSCQSGPDAGHYAERFCTCSEAFSKAAVQLQAGTIDQATYNQQKLEHETCMGEDDPLEDLKDDPEALQTFKANFLIEIKERCPSTARNMGFE